MMTTTHLLILLIVVVGLVTRPCYGYASFRERIPNGMRVPHPCKPNFIWRGVGHESLHGGGPRNPFGRDFAANEHRWTQALCQADSDGDGRTNGEELGDPNCEWREGTVSQNQLTVSHPGICDPHDTPACRAKNWDFCEQTDEFECAAINQPDVMNITLRFTRTKVPTQETTYYCMAFDLDPYLEDNVDYHLIAMKAEIDNENVMHHALLSLCYRDAEDMVTEFNSPSACDMAINPLCFNIFGAWTLGLNGQCHLDDLGFLINNRDYSKFVIQYHWNNPLLVDNYWDSSAMTIFLTKTLRPNNAAMLLVGNEDFAIPPRQSDFIVKGSCLTTCPSQSLSEPVYFVEMMNHMHYLGNAAYTEHRRNNTVLSRMADEQDFNYDNPKLYRFAPKIQFHPGDELAMYCHYASMDTDKYTYFGEGTLQEMCFGFITFYPAEAFADNTCTSDRSLDSCSFDPSVVTDGCDYHLYSNISNGLLLELMAPVIQECRVTDCRPECRQAVAEVNRHPCMRGDIGHITKVYALTEDDVFVGQYANIVAKLRSCELQDACSNPAQRFPAPSRQSNLACDLDRFMDLSNGEAIGVMTPLLAASHACNPSECQHNCIEVIKKVREHPCLHGEMGERVDDLIALMSEGEYSGLYATLHTCDAEMLCGPEDSTASSTTPLVVVWDNGASSLTTISYVAIIVPVFIASIISEMA